MNSDTAANLIGLLTRTNQFNKGDWFSALMKEAVEVIRHDGINKAVSNTFGDQIVVTEGAITINGRTWAT